jgi:hypothetical protein
LKRLGALSFDDIDFAGQTKFLESAEVFVQAANQEMKR